MVSDLSIRLFGLTSRVAQEGESLTPSLGVEVRHRWSPTSVCERSRELIDGEKLAADCEIACRERLGGLLKYYYRAA